MNPGKIFEKEFKDSVPQNCYYHRIKDNSSFDFNNPNSRFTQTNPFDVLLFYDFKLYTFELKSKKTKSLSIQTDKSEKGKDIKIHQVNGLLNANLYDGIFSGFMINFRLEENLLYFVDIQLLNEYIKTTTKKSINIKDIDDIGIKIDSTKKRIRYKYDLKKFLDEIKI